MNPESLALDAPKGTKEAAVRDNIKHWFNTSVGCVRACFAPFALRPRRLIENSSRHPVAVKVAGQLRKAVINAWHKFGIVQQAFVNMTQGLVFPPCENTDARLRMVVTPFDQQIAKVDEP